MNYKYHVENTVTMRHSFNRLLQQQDFENADISRKLRSEQCHIYIICSRPRISLSPELNITEKEIKGDFIINKGEVQELHSFTVPNPPELEIKSYKLEYPFTDIDLINESGKVVSGGKAAYLYPKLQYEYNSCLDLEVLYIGQAFGSNGERLATDRLASHSTLQRIYSDTISTYPHKEVWITLWTFEPYIISMMGKGFENARSSFDESLTHLDTVLTNPITLDQQITITEAALIKYFEPVYNKEYKSNFPSNSHSSYDQCYDLDINSVAFELHTKDLLTRLYSSSVEPSFYHTKHYPLHNDNVRKDMFKHFLESGT